MSNEPLTSEWRYNPSTGEFTITLPNEPLTGEWRYNPSTGEFTIMLPQAFLSKNKLVGTWASIQPEGLGMTMAFTSDWEVSTQTVTVPIKIGYYSIKGNKIITTFFENGTDKELTQVIEHYTYSIFGDILTLIPDNLEQETLTLKRTSHYGRTQILDTVPEAELLDYRFRLKDGKQVK